MVKTRHFKKDPILTFLLQSRRFIWPRRTQQKGAPPRVQRCLFVSQVKLRVKVINLYLRSTDDDTDTEVEDENQYPDDPSENDTEDVKEPRAETKTDREEAIEALLALSNIPRYEPVQKVN